MRRSPLRIDGDEHAQLALDPLRKGNRIWCSSLGSQWPATRAGSRCCSTAKPNHVTGGTNAKC
jgi:hypothetical protein